MILTKITKDLSYLSILLLDIPIYLTEIKVFRFTPESIEKLKKIQFFFWLIKCLTTIVYQIVELKYLKQFFEKNKSVYTELMSNNLPYQPRNGNQMSSETTTMIKKKMHLLKKNYYIR